MEAKRKIKIIALPAPKETGIANLSTRDKNGSNKSENKLNCYDFCISKYLSYVQMHWWS